MSRLACLLLWSYERGSLAYDLVWLVILLFLFLVPPSWLADPMAVRPLGAADLSPVKDMAEAGLR